MFNDELPGLRLEIRRGDGAAERAGLENRSPRKGTASSNLAPSAIIHGKAPVIPSLEFQAPCKIQSHAVNPGISSLVQSTMSLIASCLLVPY